MMAPSKANSHCSDTALVFQHQSAFFKTNTLKQEVKVQWGFLD